MNPRVYKTSKASGRASVGFDVDMGAPTVEIEVFDQYTGEPAGLQSELINIPDLKDQLANAQEMAAALQELIADLEAKVPAEFDHVKTRPTGSGGSARGPQ